MANKYYNAFQGFVKAFTGAAKPGVKGNPTTIIGVKPNVPTTTLEKAKSKLAIAKQKTKGSKAKLKQTLFNIDQASKKAKEVAKDKRNERIVKKFIGEEKADGGRIGRKLGGGADMAKKKTNIQKIKETFGPKKNVPGKFKGFSKLPEAVQQKMNKKLARKV